MATISWDNDTFGGFVSNSRFEILLQHISCVLIRLFAPSMYFSSLSIPMKFLPYFFATAPVVPVPKNGSKTISLGFVDDKITFLVFVIL